MPKSSAGNYIYDRGVSPETRVVMSIKNKVFSFVPGVSDPKNLVQIGVMSAFNISESRTIDPVRGIGYGDQIAELVPSVTEPMTIHVERAMLYAANLMQVFGYFSGVDGVVRSLKHHKWPFDVKQEIGLSDLGVAEAAGRSAQKGSEGLAVITIYEACWFNSYGVDFAADTTQVVENCDITVSDILASASLGYVGNAPLGNERASSRYSGL